MSFEVIVVGGGIGGLTAAALMAARGVSVCLIEKESRAGGCAASFEKFGYDFELGMGLYSSWQPGEIHQRVFSELPVTAPEVRKVSPSYVVRLPDQADVIVEGTREEFEERLRAHFPECAEGAIDYYRGLESRSDRPTLSTAYQLTRTSLRFRRFIDAQLQIFALEDGDSCSHADAARALLTPHQGLFSIRGGASTLADALVESIRRSGGTVRMDTTVLRLAYDSSGRAMGVDLLNGETVEATRAIVSNLTVWDTYGKLVGLSKTPNDVRAGLKSIHGWGAYLLLLGMDEEAAARLPADHIVGLTDWQDNQPYDPEEAHFVFAAAPQWDRRAPQGKRAVTVSVITEASQWFAFHEDESDLQEQDQAMLETWWVRLHQRLPELGSGVEVIDTMTPRDYYQNTRRKLGMVDGLSRTNERFSADFPSHRTALPNLFMVGDTVSQGRGIAAVTNSGLIVADEIAPSTKL